MCSRPDRPRGRPRSPDPLAARISVRVTAAQRLELRRVLDTTGGGGLAGLMREAVTDYCADLERRARRR